MRAINSLWKAHHRFGRHTEPPRCPNRLWRRIGRLIELEQTPRLAIAFVLEGDQLHIADVRRFCGIEYPRIALIVNIPIGQFVLDAALDDFVIRDDFRVVHKDALEHLKGKFHGPDGGYNILQKITYGIVLGILLPLMVFTGLAISPGFEPAAPWMVDALGGRQSARSIHFIVAWALFAFFVLHIVLVIAAGPIKHIKEMITGGTREETS